MTYTLTGANGDSITFDIENYVLNPGLIGFGVAPTNVRIDESSRPGGVWRNTRRGVRQIDLPITVLGSNAVDVETKLRRLVKIAQDGRGPTQLVASRDSGDLSLDLHYVGGAELTFGGEDAGKTWAKLVLSFQAPQPFWESTEIESFTISSGQTGRGLLPQLTKLKLSSSLSLGIIDVNNTGDVAVYPTYTVEGPISDFRAVSGDLSFGFNDSIGIGEVISVNTETGEVTDQGGNNRYALLTASPKLFPFQPGETAVTIEGTGTTLDTRVIVTYALRYEVVHG